MPNPVRIRTAPAPLGLSVAAAALLVAATLAMPRVTYAAEMTHSPAMQTQTAPSQPAATKPVA
ncbi:MAG: hypothetical protein ACREE3_15355, partial [Stellaceae bacterium]